MSHIESKTAGSFPGGRRAIWISLAVLGTIAVLLVYEVKRTQPHRQAMAVYYRLIAAASRQDAASARSLCTQDYLRRHDPAPAAEGGLMGLPRNIPHKNFRVWNEGVAVLVCPSDRIGPVFRFLPEGDGWKFDGPIGLLQSDGRIVVLDGLD